jgi:outer membrane protein assembly factor BamD (BamD/ComL family)
MVLRAAGLLVALASVAPLQCGHTSDPELQLDETPGDALWTLAQRFEAANDAAGERRTLEYLVQQYPASRWAPAAREKLAQLGGGDGGGGS